MEQMISFFPGKDGYPGYFPSSLPLKPFNINSVKGNKVTTRAFKETSASTKTRICWDSSRNSKESASLNSILLKGTTNMESVQTYENSTIPSN